MFTRVTIPMFCLLVLGLCHPPCEAEDTAQPERKVREKVTGTPTSAPIRFGGYEDSYAIWNTMRNNGWAGADEGALRLHYSLKYTVCGSRVVSRKAGAEAATNAANLPKDEGGFCRLLGVSDRAELFVGYTGEFDFYAGTRPSGPVINRLSMPGVYWR